MYPIFLDLTAEKCLVVGGGKVAARKIVPLLAAWADVTVVSPAAGERIRDYAIDGKIHWEKREYEDGEAGKYFLVIAATDDMDLNERVTRDVDDEGHLINTVDVPELCNFYVPSVVNRGEMQIALSTSGACPALARKLRKKLEAEFPEAYGKLVKKLRSFREAVIRTEPDINKRKEIIEQLVWSEEVEKFLGGDEQPLEDALKKWNL